MGNRAKTDTRGTKHKHHSTETRRPPTNPEWRGHNCYERSRHGTHPNVDEEADPTEEPRQLSTKKSRVDGRSRLVSANIFFLRWFLR